MKYIWGVIIFFLGLGIGLYLDHRYSVFGSENKIQSADSNNQGDFTLKMKCRDLAEQYRKENEVSGGDTLYFNPTYGFNKNLNTCVYISGFISGKVKDQYIIDLTTNKEIFDATTFDNTPQTIIDEL